MTEQIVPISGGYAPERKRQHALGVAIPTYNRAARLSRSLDELREIIVRHGLKDSVSVYVTDNGSTDTTREVLVEQSRKFENDGISFFHESVEANKGFDNNIKRCFTRGAGDYCWFVSDDDNLKEDVLEKILGDIREYEPNLMMYNFDQAPYGKSSPLISEKKFFTEGKTDFAFAQFVRFPKLTSLVVRRINDPLQGEVFNYEHVLSSGFSFTALAMQTGYHYGRILLSNEFCGSPDAHHRDHIDFPPYIGNRLNRMCKTLFEHMARPEWANLYSIPHTDVGVSALEWLIDHYKGRAVVPYELRLELRKGLNEYVAERKFKVLLHPKFIRRCIYFAVAWIRFFILEKVFHVPVIKHRSINK